MVKAAGDVACPNEPKAPLGLPNVAAPPKEGVPKAGGLPKAPLVVVAPAAAGAENPVCKIDEPPCINDPPPVLGAAPKIDDVPKPVDPPKTLPPPNALGAKVELPPPKTDDVAEAELVAAVLNAEAPPNIDVPAAGTAAGVDGLNAFVVEAAACAKIPPPPPNGDDEVAAAAMPPNGDDDVAVADTPPNIDVGLVATLPAAAADTVPNGDDGLVATLPNGLFWATGVTAALLPPKIDVPPPLPPNGDENTLEDVAVPPNTDADDAAPLANMDCSGFANEVAVIDVVGTDPPKMLVPAGAGVANEPNGEADDTTGDGCVPNALLPPNGVVFVEAAAATLLKMDADESVEANEEPPNMLAPLAGGVAAAVAAGTVGLHTFRPWNKLSATIGDNGSEVKDVFVEIVELLVVETMTSGEVAAC